MRQVFWYSFRNRSGYGGPPQVDIVMQIDKSYTVAGPDRLVSSLRNKCSLATVRTVYVPCYSMTWWLLEYSTQSKEQPPPVLVRLL